MKTNFITIAALFCAFLHGVSATPVEIKELSKRQGIPGQPVLCSMGNQCSTIHLPFDGSTVCTDLSGSLLFLHHNLANVTIDDVGCLVFPDFGCAGTTFGGDVALGGTLTIDLTNLNGKDVACSVSSLSCSFL
ncbi:hypothetical protein BDZ94DRAFT_1293268 [Collybia nuda]|uniref:Uncharacterized protein n=1 Tax=Collybia nuda TaxID=64659 RepID=A0A9P5YJ42_9AGAR|nr:hypothetical protein BDZ94DRAFT_1293268 [Collybia nuda]